MRDVNNGWIIRYTHANVASFFFIFVYMHVARGMYYGSYKSPRVLLWSIGVIILILMMAIAFLGYVLPYGQMSLWGKINFCALHDNKILNIESNLLIYNSIIPILTKEGIIKSKIKSTQRIGPHNYEIFSILMGSLLGDAYAERHGNGTRICFQQEEFNSSYLLWFHEYLSERGYCNKTKPKITNRIGNNGKIRYLSRFKTYTYSSFNWIHENFYKENKKVVPQNISEYLSPLALAVWIQDDGSRISSGLKIATNNFTLEEVIFLAEVLKEKYQFKISIQKAGDAEVNQYILYFSKNSMNKLVETIKPYMHNSMYYKLNGYI